MAGGHINPAVTFGLFLARKLSLTRAIFYMVMQCLGAICGAGVVKGFDRHNYQLLGGGANIVNHGYTKGDALGAEIVGTFVLVYTVLSATDAKRNARDSHVPVSNLSTAIFHLYHVLCLIVPMLHLDPLMSDIFNFHLTNQNYDYKAFVVIQLFWCCSLLTRFWTICGQCSQLLVTGTIAKYLVFVGEIMGEFL